MLLEGLDTVAWARLTCTFGAAGAVPDWIRQLTSPSPAVRRAAAWWLSEAFVHQDTVWTAALAAVPFLIEVLGATDGGGKDDLLELLTYIADRYYHAHDAPAAEDELDNEIAEPDEVALAGDAAMGAEDDAGNAIAGEDEVDDGWDGDAPSALYTDEEADEDNWDLDDWDPTTAYEDDTNEYDEANEDSQPQRAAVRAGIPVYLALLDDSEPAVRIAAAHLLARCRSAEFDPRVPLEAARGRETHPGVAAGLLLALGQLCRGREEKAAFFADTLRAQERSDVEQIVAAIELVDVAGETAPTEAVELLVGALAHPSRRLNAAYRMATGGAWLVGRIGYVMRQVSPTRLSMAVPILTAVLPRIGRERQRAAVSVIVTALFPTTEGAALPAESLTSEQHAALEAIFAAAPYWRSEHDFLTPLDERGLPDTRPALAEYLGLALPPEDALGAVDQPHPHRPMPFTLKAYEARLHQVERGLYQRRKPGYRFEPDHEVDFYSPDGFHFYYFPKTPEGVLAMERAVAVLHALPSLPLMRWHPTSYSRDTRAVGRTFMGGFDLVRGEPLTPEALERLRGTQRWDGFATLLARFLRELHAAPLERIPIPLPPAESREAWEQVYAEVRARLFDHLSREMRQRIADRFEEFLAEPGNWTWHPTIVHGDFAPRNIIYCTFRDGDVGMSGIDGWWRVGLGDPALDLATLLGPDGYGEEFIRRFAEEYPDLESELPRARFYASMRPLRDALATADGCDKEALERALAYHLA